MRYSIVIFSFIFSLLANTALAQDFVYRKGDKAAGWKKGVATANGLKVVWWNIGCIHPDQKKKIGHNESPENLLQNIEALLEHQKLKPDILILGEYCAEAVGEEREGTLEFLKSHYPHMSKISRYTRYHKSNGLRVFSKYKLTDIRKVRLRAGNWLDDPQMKKCAKGKEKQSIFQKGRYAFPIIEFKVKAKGKNYKLVGTHFPNPWLLWAKCKGKKSAGLQMLFGKSNPNYKHAAQLTRRYKDANRTMIIGDFNAPKSIKVWFFKMVSKSYKLLSQYFGQSVIKSTKATGISHNLGFSIDHAFVTDDMKVKYSKVIGLAGSDHLPIYVIIQ